MAAKLIRMTHKIATATASSGRELYHLQFSLQEISPETFGYTVVFYNGKKPPCYMVCIQKNGFF
jgi:hypothetical protein